MNRSPYAIHLLGSVALLGSGYCSCLLFQAVWHGSGLAVDANNPARFYALASVLALLVLPFVRRERRGVRASGPVGR